jgi:hypothetical protein
VIYLCACALLSLPAPDLLLPPARALKGCRTVVQPMAAARRLRFVVRDVCTKNRHIGHHGVWLVVKMQMAHSSGWECSTRMQRNYSGTG